MDARAAIWDFQSQQSELFLSTSHPDASYQVSGQLAFQFKLSREKYIFKMATILDYRMEQF